jgi:hypothetical protein
MATFYQTQRDETYLICEYSEAIEKEGGHLFSKFRQILNSYTLFHVSFFFLALLELSLFSISIFNYSESVAFIITLASMVLTIFSYLILNYYFQGKKSEQFKELRSNFAASCKKHIVPTLQPLQKAPFN